MAVGKLIAENAINVGIKAVVFDRGGFLYHGRIKALANSAREDAPERVIASVAAAIASGISVKKACTCDGHFLEAYDFLTSSKSFAPLRCNT